MTFVLVNVELVRLQEVMAIGVLREHQPESDGSAGDGVGVEHKRDGDEGGDSQEERLVA